MRIEFSVEGGLAYFPGLSKPVALDAGRLAKDEAGRLRQLVEAARFFDLPENPQALERAGADCQYCILTVDDDGRKHTVRVAEPIRNPALADLVQAVREHAKAARAAQRSS
jgi:hypothetical protein